MSAPVTPRLDGPWARVATAAVVLLALVTLSTMVMVVDPAEVAVVYRFGAVDRTLGAGLGFRLPLIERAERIRVTEVRRVELPRVRLLTGDTNLIELELVVQYSVADPVLYALVHADPEKVIADEVASTATTRVANLMVDELLTTGRTELQQALMESAQKSLDALATGVRLVAVDVRDLVPPAAVVNAFNDVSSAKGDQDTMRLAADAYASKVLPDVRGRASQLQEQALSDATSQAARADGDIARFQALLPAYHTDPAAMRIQLREELLGHVGPKMKVMAVTPGAEVFLGDKAPAK
jgi:membrane protease subunit HflK